MEIPAIVCNLRDNPQTRWCAEFPDGTRIPIHPDDTWNFDVSRGLQVWLKSEGERCHRDPQGFCRIIRKRGNKKYVKIGQPDPVKSKSNVKSVKVPSRR